MQKDIDHGKTSFPYGPCEIASIVPSTDRKYRLNETWVRASSVDDDNDDDGWPRLRRTCSDLFFCNNETSLGSISRNLISESVLCMPKYIVWIRAHYESNMLNLTCWIQYVESNMVNLTCGIQHAESNILNLICWIQYTKSNVLNQTWGT
jgi:hypothetical protein